MREPRPWTAEEEYVLRNSTKPLAEIAQELGRSVSSVQARRFALGITQQKPLWTAEEDHYLWEHRHERVADVARHLGRTTNAIQQHKAALALTWPDPRRSWTQAEDDYLRAHIATPVQQCADALERSVGSVWARRHRLGLHVRPDAPQPQTRSPSGAPAHRRRWQPSEDEYLRSHVDVPARRVAALLGRSAQVVTARRRHLGLSRSRSRTQDGT